MSDDTVILEWAVSHNKARKAQLLRYADDCQVRIEEAEVKLLKLEINERIKKLEGFDEDGPCLVESVTYYPNGGKMKENKLILEGKEITLSDETVKNIKAAISPGQDIIDIPAEFKLGYFSDWYSLGQKLPDSTHFLLFDMVKRDWTILPYIDYTQRNVFLKECKASEIKPGDWFAYFTEETWEGIRDGDCKLEIDDFILYLGNDRGINVTEDKDSPIDLDGVNVTVAYSDWKYYKVMTTEN